MFCPSESTLQRPPHRRNHRLVGCCVDPLSSGHPRPVLRPSLNILMGAILAPQTREPAAVGANLGTVRLQWAQGELQHRDLGPWRITPWKYGAKPLGVVRLLILCEFLVWREKRIVMAGEKLWFHYLSVHGCLLWFFSRNVSFGWWRW